MLSIAQTHFIGLARRGSRLETGEAVRSMHSSTGSIYFAGMPPECWKEFDLVINCGSQQYPNVDEEKRYLYLPIPEGKKGQFALKECIPSVLDFYNAYGVRKKVLIHCMQGRDRSVSVAVAILARFFRPTASGDLVSTENDSKEFVVHDKESLRGLLLFIQQYRHEANPCRAFLKRLNELFIDQ